MDLNSRLNKAIESVENLCTIQEGSLLSVSKIMSDAIKIPSGNYLIASVNSGNCILIPTSEANGQTFEVFKKTLEGFYNKEIHSKLVNTNDGEVIK